MSDDPNAEVAKLRRRLDDLEAVLATAGSGEADGLVVPNGVVSRKGVERPYQEFFDSMHEGGLTLDGAGRILHCNPRFATMLESSVEGLQGTLLRDHVAKCSQTRLHDLTTQGKHAVAAVSLVTNSGAELLTLLSVGPIDSAEDDLICVVVSDLREQSTSAVAALLDSEAFSRGILDSYPAAMAVLDHNGTILAVNQPWQAFAIENSNIPGSPAAGTGVGSDYLAQSPPAIAAGIRSVMTGGASHFTREYPCHSPNEKRWFVMNTTALSTGGEAVVVSHTDITDRVLLEQQLRQAQKMEAVGQLTGGLAHDFNNILAVVIGNLEELALLGRLDSEEEELTNEALAAAARGAALAHRLLAVARQQSLAPQHIELNTLLSDLSRSLRRILGENIKLALVLSRDAWPIKVDPAQFEAAILNLATNARDAMPNGGRLTIATANCPFAAVDPERGVDVPPGDYVMVEATDTGTGIPPNLMDRIFDPFFTTKERGQGAGLGLAIVSGFVNQSGGHIKVSSEPGVGATFRLYLPRSTSASPVAEKPRDAGIARGTGETVLVVEDNTDLRRLVVRQIAGLGYRVLEAVDGTAALEVLRQERVDLMLSDVLMPGGIDGVELADQVMKNWLETKVILTSGFPEIRTNVKLEATLASLRLLIKPYSRIDLAQALRDAIDAGRRKSPLK